MAAYNVPGPGDTEEATPVCPRSRELCSGGGNREMGSERNKHTDDPVNLTVAVQPRCQVQRRGRAGDTAYVKEVTFTPTLKE